MNFKLKILFLGLLLVLCVNSVSAADSLNNITLNDDIVLNESYYVVDETILIDHDVSISAKDYSTISAAGDNTIFNVSSNARLTLSNLNLTNARGVNGGAIYNNGVLVLNNCTFVNNKATLGGAIYNNGTMILNNCTFESNTVSVSGGAIYNLQNNLIIQNSSFFNNKGAIKNGELKGGAICNMGFGLTVDGCSFTNNGLYNSYWYKNGIQYGGAVYDCGGNLTVKSSIFDKNFIYGYTDNQKMNVRLNWKYGAAIYTESCKFKLINNIFDSNEIYSMLSSYSKQKILNSGVGTVYALKVIAINNTFLNNSANNPALYIVGNGSYIANNYFQNNSASEYSLGNAIYVQGHNTVFCNNTFINNTGGDKLLDGASIFITRGGNETIEYNYFENGNGIAYEGLESFSQNYKIDKFNVTIKNNVFNNCFMGIYLHNATLVNVDSNQFINNSIGIHTYVGKYLNIANNYFKGGNSINFGTAIDSNTNKTLIMGNVFDGIKSNINEQHYGSQGGIIYLKLRYDDEVDVEGNFFINNEISSASGIISSEMANIKIKNNYFGNNTLNNGSIFNLDNSKVKIFNNIFEGNGGLLFKSDSDFYYFNDVEFIENLIKEYTGNIYDYSQFKNNASTLIESSNREYAESSSSIWNMVEDIVKNIKDAFNNGRYPFVNSTECDNNKTVSNNTSEIANKTDFDGNFNSDVDTTSTGDIKTNSTDSKTNYGVENSLNKLSLSVDQSNNGNYHELKATKSIAGDSSSSSSGDSSSPEVHEIEKSNVSKDIADDNYFIWIVLVIVVIFALLAIGYKKR